MDDDRTLAKEDMKRNLEREHGRRPMGQHPAGTGVGAVAAEAGSA